VFRNVTGILEHERQRPCCVDILRSVVRYVVCILILPLFCKGNIKSLIRNNFKLPASIRHGYLRAVVDLKISGLVAKSQTVMIHCK